MMLADRLKKSVEEVLQMTTLEFELWSGYFMFEDKENRKTMMKAKQQQKGRR
jgi:hypothetical protein